jgi:cytidyltransferase-like protein
MRRMIALFMMLSFSLAAAEDRPTRVYVDMVADLFHYGHVEFLKQASEQGDELIVGLISDEVAEGYKRRPILSLEERVRSVEGCKYVTKVLPNCPLAVTKEWILEHNIDFVVHGDDFNEETIRTYYGVPIDMGIFRTVPYTGGVSTSDLIKRIAAHATARAEAG